VVVVIAAVKTHGAQENIPVTKLLDKIDEMISGEAHVQVAMGAQNYPIDAAGDFVFFGKVIG
jgi:hypothetical protein